MQNPEKSEERFPYLESLARLLHYSAGITKTITRGERTIQFRAASCTGALFHIELYVVTSRLPGLRAGIYHFDPESSSLQKLRSGDFRQAIFDATSNFAIDDSPAVVVATSAFWRNAYKYQGRAFRHAFWDGGTLISQVLAMASLLGLHAPVLQGFVDMQISTLLGLDPQEEFPVALIPLGYSGLSTLKPLPEVDIVPFATVKHDLQRLFEPIEAMVQSSSLTSIDQVEAFRKAKPKLPAVKGGEVQMRPQSLRKIETVPLEKLIPRRGSTRQFSQDPIDLTKLSNLLKMGTSPIVGDFYGEFGDRLNGVYLAVHNVDGLDMGSYRFYPESNRLELIQQGYFREVSRQLGLGQDLAADAAVIVYFIADLKALLGTYGNRAYRLAQLEGGILGGKMYLAAYAQQFGATGLTFVDDAVTEFFGLSDSHLVSFMICLGHKAKK